MTKNFKLNEGDYGRRLDVVLAEKAGISRNMAALEIETGRGLVNAQPSKSSYHLEKGDKLSWQPLVNEPREETAAPKLSIIYEDANVIVINKPAGLLVHATDNPTSEATVADFARKHSRDTDTIRPGIVHRLDRETSGLMMLAKTLASKSYLQDQLRARKIQKTYLVLVHGRLKQPEAEINLPLERGATGLKQVVSPGGRSAVTRYKVLAEYPGYSLVEAYPVTGRTHQLRVHFAHLGHPIAGDRIYGRPSPGLNRLFLHAKKLEFTGPDKKRIEVETELPPELKNFLAKLEKLV